MRRLVGFVAAAALMGGSIALADPASAATFTVSETDCASGMDGKIYTVPSGDDFEITFATCAGWVISSSSPGTFNVDYVQGGIHFDTGFRKFTADRFGGALPDGTYVVFFANGQTPGYTGSADGSFTISVGGGGGDSSSTNESAPVLETLTLQVSTGNTTCTGGSPTGYSGSWLQLPAADACSQAGPDANPNAKLLGWATSPQFPVSVAQQIVDLKYGPIDAVIDGTRMIFIPAGGWTFVSGSNNLFPIWSS